MYFRSYLQEDCEPDSCFCVPNGDCYATDYAFNPTFHDGMHGLDYFITLTVTNNAQLVTTQTIKVSLLYANDDSYEIVHSQYGLMLLLKMLSTYAH